MRPFARALPTRPTLPQVVVNLKAYPQTLGEGAILLAKAAKALEERTGVIVAIAPQAVDLRACVKAGARVYAQHVDHVLKPEATGWQSIGAIQDAGCEGTLINHSEHRVDKAAVDWYTDAATEAGLVSILCTRDAQESRLYARAHPSLVAVEPPELIGGDISVTTADPQVVRRSVDAVQRAAPGIGVLCGAGIKNGDDVAKAVELGAYGILVASGVTKAKDPARALADLARGFPSAFPRGRRVA
jgi:triosephosphate isomerase